MKSLTVFYDADCGICTSFRRWIAQEPAHVGLRFLPYNSREAAQLCPDLAKLGADREIIVMADDGRLWQGAGAWVTCLWALRRWRGWSRRLASPALLPLAARVCRLISTNRLTLARLLHLRSERELAGVVTSMGAPCPDHRCAFSGAKRTARKEEA